MFRPIITAVGLEKLRDIWFKVIVENLYSQQINKKNLVLE